MTVGYLSTVYLSARSTGHSLSSRRDTERRKFPTPFLRTHLESVIGEGTPGPLTIFGPPPCKSCYLPTTTFGPPSSLTAWETGLDKVDGVDPRTTKTPRHPTTGTRGQ